ncbi:Glycerol-3-phosphate dehydrogenase, mitochondrial [Colletotrichum higginsianum]|uniref:glycerol-3-phosphate dehydrogenase n=1 Tax=Colletotrichum higginsianum TaxID=80884 RepID=A0A4T0VWY6_9PEZI|nr:Glycerol-3-phosphate dehydrogenase, mitochondrial [Colletotrichum higginsianum]
MRSKTLEAFPVLKRSDLAGAHNDFRITVSIGVTAALHGASVDMGSARDRQTPPPHEIRIRAKFIINCTGPFTDSLRKMDDHNCKTIVAPVSRVYAILPGQHGPRRPLHVRRPRHLLPTVAGQNHRWHHQRARVHHAESAARRKVDWMDPKLVRNHLVDNYGDRAWSVAILCRPTDKRGERPSFEAQTLLEALPKVMDIVTRELK